MFSVEAKGKKIAVSVDRVARVSDQMFHRMNADQRKNRAERAKASLAKHDNPQSGSAKHAAAILVSQGVTTL